MSQPGHSIVSTSIAGGSWGWRVPAALVVSALLPAMIGCASKQAEPTEVKVPAGPLGVAPIQISWAFQNTVESNNIYGYNVYRSNARDGEFQKINEDLVVPNPEDPNPDFVVFEDRGLALGETFFYYVEAVTQDGKQHKATIVYPLRVTREMTSDEVKAWKAEQARKAKAKKEKPAE